MSLQNFTGKSVAILDDASLMSLMLAKHAKGVQIVEPNNHFMGIISAYVDENEITNIRTYDDYASVPYHEVTFIRFSPEVSYEHLR